MKPAFIENETNRPPIAPPLLLCAVLKERGIRSVALLGTRSRAEEETLRKQLFAVADADIVLPSQEDRDRVVRIVDHELARGITRERSRVDLIRLMQALKAKGAKAIALVTPELSLLIEAGDAEVPVLNATESAACEAAALDLMENRVIA